MYTNVEYMAHMELILVDNFKQWIQICGGYCILNDEFHEIHYYTGNSIVNYY